MQIDFHHAVTYIAARAAGFGHREAETVAYCSQYVDDATNKGAVKFDTGAMFSRISSAHKALDYRNFAELANHHVWIPFHFLPGNGGKRPGENPDGTFIEKILCLPDSHVARDMICDCIQEKDKLYGLHRLGVTMHVFADTWAHQGFAGVIHQMNHVTALNEKGESDSNLNKRLKKLFGDLFNEAAGEFVGDVLPLGHGAALSHPDKPFLKWSYKDANGKKVKRNNSKNFLIAADEMCKSMQRYRSGDSHMEAPGLPDLIKDKIYKLFKSITNDEGKDRHKKWLEHIKNGDFGFPPVKLTYKAKGSRSWKHQAVGTRKMHDKKSDIFAYDSSFLGSDWKLFHDALRAHRFSIIHDILPKYGICAA